MTQKLVLATRNRGKVEELRRILRDAGLDVELVGMDEFPDVSDVTETGVTFEENALLKARRAVAATGLPAVADDSGLCVDVMGGMPGIFSARWSGGRGDAANLQLVLKQIADLGDEHRAARFVCAVALVTPEAAERVVFGEVPGRLTREPRGIGGFGYDPIFLPDGKTRTTAEMPAAEKDAISHRGRAMRALVPVLREVLGA
jgi:XTP/dITP diphosphohydrolase